MAKPDAGKDRAYMDHALRLAARGLGRTRPNPTVGCVIVKEDRIIGRGWHRKAGGPHAEVEALRMAGEAARGATAYVTLEPCSHHGRTPPCCEGLIKAGIRRVVAAMEDPNPLVSGQGFQRLKQAGVVVQVGVREEAAQMLIRPFITRILHNRPMVTLKSAASLDGKTATRERHSQWITGEAARKRGHRLRDTHDVILTGIQTVLADDPRLTCRLKGGRDPIRVVVDSSLKLSENAGVINPDSTAPVWVATTLRAPEEKRALFALLPGVEVIMCAEDDTGRVDLYDLMEKLAKREITSVLAEAGGVLSGALLDKRLVDRIALFMAPMLIGGREASGILDSLGAAKLTEAPRLDHVTLTSLDGDLLVEGCVVYGATEG
ncbi:diaminohydroxyphosphoribosylaminopyrimidine deaminase / 5-amino-6-(5-phosphoribosylamino)uracil reductase [Magnetococcus marinus MC-1]|uniref:Riboflavin biosynthesis protein RibD n=1 Tax=Magnetococcus marinus (strain ATCC BAA-1437 / JCM 17883 / MC-1) TaxID=156889 RepID=A0L402_MAGMM|nr:bifunctional diaminohydroxyphosphoribosylaminopyrimidine deaminase/5-amino-6-(5-phosphoribosylamino)uracil reductase RibD [Magnetococcus marinus]ABK42695.1 diaminohydroxyphosphoribosylaminopyrimidine deaminase / 5-amino-6-(5-phosphoribosylamino)uracil reductase [Magnetococcus marinus MC-1]